MKTYILPVLAEANVLDLLSPFKLGIGLALGALILFMFYRPLFQLLGVVIVPEDRIGLVTKKFVLFGRHKAIPAGRIIATNGEAGFQAQTLAPGIYFWKWIWQYEIKLQPFVVIPDGAIGLVMSKGRLRTLPRCRARPSRRKRTCSKTPNHS